MGKLAVALVVLLSTAATASAQSAEIGLSAGWSAFSDNDIGTISDFSQGLIPITVDNGVRIGFRLAFNPGYFLGHELSYSYQKSGLSFGLNPSNGMTVQNIYYNLVVHATPEGSPIRPFGTAGAGISVFFPPGVSSLSGRGDNKFGYNLGGGLKFKLNPLFGFRIDLRDHVTGRPLNLDNAGGRFHNVEYSGTFSILF